MITRIPVLLLSEASFHSRRSYRPSPTQPPPPHPTRRVVLRGGDTPPHTSTASTPRRTSTPPQRLFFRLRHPRRGHAQDRVVRSHHLLINGDSESHGRTAVALRISSIGIFVRRGVSFAKLISMAMDHTASKVQVNYPELGVLWTDLNNSAERVEIAVVDVLGPHA